MHIHEKSVCFIERFHFSSFLTFHARSKICGTSVIPVSYFFLYDLRVQWNQNGVPWKAKWRPLKSEMQYFTVSVTQLCPSFIYSSIKLFIYSSGTVSCFSTFCVLKCQLYLLLFHLLCHFGSSLRYPLM